MASTYLHKFAILIILTVIQLRLVSPQIGNNKNAPNLCQMRNMLIEYLNVQALLVG